jgi:hypothetical protein
LDRTIHDVLGVLDIVNQVAAAPVIPVAAAEG